MTERKAFDGLYPLPEGARPFHEDAVIVAAGAGSTDLVEPDSSRRVVVGSVTLSSSTAQRVAVVDDEDAPGRRIVDVELPIAGSLAPVLSPPYPGKRAGSPVRLINGAAGTIRVAIRGWTIPEG